MAGIVSTIYAKDDRDGELSYQPIDCPAKIEGIRMVCYRYEANAPARLCPFAVRMVIDGNPSLEPTYSELTELRWFGTGIAKRLASICLLARGADRIEAGVPPF